MARGWWKRKKLRLPVTKLENAETHLEVMVGRFAYPNWHLLKIKFKRVLIERSYRIRSACSLRQAIRFIFILIFKKMHRRGPLWHNKFVAGIVYKSRVSSSHACVGVGRLVYQASVHQTVRFFSMEKRVFGSLKKFVLFNEQQWSSLDGVKGSEKKAGSSSVLFYANILHFLSRSSKPADTR